MTFEHRSEHGIKQSLFICLCIVQVLTIIYALHHSGSSSHVGNVFDRQREFRQTTDEIIDAKEDFDHLILPPTTIPPSYTDIKPPNRPRVLQKQVMPLLYYNHSNVDLQKYPIPYPYTRPLCPDTRSYHGTWAWREVPDIRPPKGTDAKEYKGLRANHAFFEPSGCRYHTFTRQDLDRCLAGKRLVFSGDSLIRNQAAELINRYYEPNFRFWGNGQSDGNLTIHTEAGKPIDIQFLWNPDVYSFRPTWVTPGKKSQVDLLVLSMAPWDLGVYNFGVAGFYGNFTRMLRETVASLDNVTTSQLDVPPQVYLYRMHKMHHTRCRHNGGFCDNCNTDIRQQWYREAQMTAYNCFDEKTSTEERIKMFDPLDMTDNIISYDKTLDGVHLQIDAVFMELTMLLNDFCSSSLEASGIYEERYGSIEREILHFNPPKCHNFAGVNETLLSGNCPRATKLPHPEKDGFAM